MTSNFNSPPAAGKSNDGSRRSHFPKNGRLSDTRDGSSEEASNGYPSKLERNLDPLARRQGKCKLDAFLLTTVTVAYFLSFVDRSNIGNARAAGLQTDLGLTDRQYSICLTVTYIPYIVAEVPLTLAMKSIGPNRLIPALVVTWGVVSTFQGFVSSYGGLIAARFFLGACEGAILPGSITYLSTFYTRTDLGKRIAFFFSATSLAGAFSGLLAAAIIQMDGIQGKPGWSWVFILEGIFTVICGFSMFFNLPRTISTTPYLTQEQKKSLELALEMDGTNTEEDQPFSVRVAASALLAPQVWLVCIQFFAGGTLLYSLAYFAPTIVEGLGYRGTYIQLYSVPPYVCSTVVSISINYASDRLRLRGPFIVFLACISTAGYALYLGSTNKSVLYGALFLQVIGAYSLAALTGTWMPNNVTPYYKRTTAIVMGFIFTNAGGILSTWLFPTSEGPRFHRGTSVLLGLSSSIIAFGALTSLYLSRQNASKERALRQGESESIDRKGDRALGFRYIP